MTARVETHGALPQWAIDDDVDVPLQFMRSTDTIDLFRLGNVDECGACVLVDRGAWRANPDMLIPLAAGAWHKLTGFQCERDMAEVIAHGWVNCADTFEQALH